jgi:acetylglutamate kinase
MENGKMSTALEKATVLAEALPYIKRFHGKIIVIKYGGNAMISEQLKRGVMDDIILMQLVGMRPVLVHGGGPDISAMLDKLQIKSHFINGLRYTDETVMTVAEMVLNGKINKDIVSRINISGGRAVGICGKDGNLFRCKRLQQPDLGLVGSIEEINTDLLLSLMKDNYLPVISPIGGGENGESYNTNADYAAGRVAEALKAEKFILLTDVEGLFADPETKKELISVLPVKDFPLLAEKGIISGGMLPKVKCCVNAINNGVASAHIIDGRQMHSILLEIFTDKGVGTQIVPD